MTITFRPGIRTQTPIIAGITGPSRSGKSWSALRLATGLAQGKPIAVVDTESSRALQYAEKFSFLHGDLAPPFTYERYLEAIRGAKEAGAKVIIVDSISHAHDGPGGLLDQHEKELDKLAGNDWKRREKLTFSAWVRPKHSLSLFISALLQMGADYHFILCFRAKDRLILRKGEEPLHAGWAPIASAALSFECSFMLVLPEGSQGRVDLNAQSSGLRDPFQDFIKDGQQIDEKLGETLARWAAGAKGGVADRTGEPGAGGLVEPPVAEEYARCNAVEFAALEARRLKTWQLLTRDQRAELKSAVEYAQARLAEEP